MESFRVTWILCVLLWVFSFLWIVLLNVFLKIRNFIMGYFQDVPGTKPRNIPGTLWEDILGMIRGWSLKWQIALTSWLHIMCSSMEVVLFVLNFFGKFSNFKMGSFWDIPETKPKDFHGTFLEEIHGIFRGWFIKHLLRIFSRGYPQNNLLISFGRLGVFICSVFINFCFVCFFL